MAKEFLRSSITVELAQEGRRLEEFIDFPRIVQYDALASGEMILGPPVQFGLIAAKFGDNLNIAASHAFGNLFDQANVFLH